VGLPARDLYLSRPPQGVVKRRVSAFARTDLETILRAREVDTLILFGIATSGVVLGRNYAGSAFIKIAGKTVWRVVTLIRSWQPQHMFGEIGKDQVG
jgi:hypothetical protein